MERKLTITGKAKLSVSPDIVILSFNIFGHEWEYEASMNTLDDKVNTLRAILISNGIKKEELKTKNFSVDRSETYDRKEEKSKFNGFKATHDMDLILPLDKVLLNKLLTEISSISNDLEFDISFGVKNTEPFGKELIKIAITNGKETAQLICESSGVELKEILNIDYDIDDLYIRSQASSNRQGFMNMDRSLTPDFEPDNITISDSINITWRID